MLDPDFEALAARVLPSNIAAGWQGCEITCDECWANVGNLRNGVHYRILGRENQLFGIIFTYLPSSGVRSRLRGDHRGGDHGPWKRPLSSIGAKPCTATPATPRPSNGPSPTPRLRFASIWKTGRGCNSRSVTGSRKKVRRWGPSFRRCWPGCNMPRPPGTGRASTPEETIGPPCDGRGIPGSRLADLTGKPNAPDLRGMFLRGLNQFDPEEPEPATEDRKDPDSGRKTGSFQGHNVGGHEHTYRRRRTRYYSQCGRWR